MNDPRHPATPSRPMPQPAKPSGLVDPLVATAHAVGTPRPVPHQGDKVRIDGDSIELVDDETSKTANANPLLPGDSFSAKRIVALGDTGAKFSENWKRTPVRNGTGACRVRSFHGKYSDEGLKYLDHAINTWLDAHPEVEVKFVTHTVNLFEGKIREPALVLNVWY
jgi:hypothetical protein